MSNAVDPKVIDFIKRYIEDYKVVVFMKGTPNMPHCAFSSKVVNILKVLDVSFIGINILEDESLRQALKVFSDWPTFPQVYVDGEFIGGCDIIQTMYEQGELQKLLADFM